MSPRIWVMPFGRYAEQCLDRDRLCGLDPADDDPADRDALLAAQDRLHDYAPAREGDARR